MQWVPKGKEKNTGIEIIGEIRGIDVVQDQDQIQNEGEIEIDINQDTQTTINKSGNMNMDGEMNATTAVTLVRVPVINAAINRLKLNKKNKKYVWPSATTP